MARSGIDFMAILGSIPQEETGDHGGELYEYARIINGAELKQDADIGAGVKADCKKPDDKAADVKANGAKVEGVKADYKKH